jgi:4-nitrophenyl phosphatase
VGVTVSAEAARQLARVRSFVIDMDGVLYRGDTILPHVHDFFGALDTAHVPYVMVTNNSTRTPQQYVEKLAGMGLTTTADRVVTSGLATRSWIERRYSAGTRVYLIGMPALVETIFGDGRYAPAGIDAEVVVTGADWDLTFEKLKIATLAIRHGAAWVATNPDTTFPSEQGIIPGAGAILAAIAAATSAKPVVIGKPEPGMLVEAAAMLHTQPGETAMLGDRLDTDILAGQRAGVATVLVLTGVTTPDELSHSAIQPDVALPDLAPLASYYGAPR